MCRRYCQPAVRHNRASPRRQAVRRAPHAGQPALRPGRSQSGGRLCDGSRDVPRYGNSRRRCCCCRFCRRPCFCCRNRSVPLSEQRRRRGQRGRLSRAQRQRSADRKPAGRTRRIQSGGGGFFGVCRARLVRLGAHTRHAVVNASRKIPVGEAAAREQGGEKSKLLPVGGTPFVQKAAEYACNTAHVGRTFHASLNLE